ncbi:MAG: hypothetical protein ACD_23C00489G0002 [uncultured bacterium]|nr:MAG: hypothetical protein ACD_23C00489G0002 [uncultured bacterium]
MDTVVVLLLVTNTLMAVACDQNLIIMRQRFFVFEPNFP